VQRYAELTGLSPDYVDRADLRVELDAFTGELLRDRGLQLGRLDLRFTGWLERGKVSGFEDDPSYLAILGPYAAAANAYLGTELGYRTDVAYRVLTGKVGPWSYREFEGRPISVTSGLARAMRANPALRVHVSCGYLDGVTPHFAAEHVFAHLSVPDAQAAQIEWAYYEAGHMMYVHEPTRRQQSADLADFVRRAATATPG
jgi:carboxypeptidase C (cathepsin A)